MALICLLLQIYVLLIIARILLSWFPLDPDGAMATVGGFLFVITDPVLGPVRRSLPPLRLGAVGLDLSPIVVIIGVQIIAAIIC